MNRRTFLAALLGAGLSPLKFFRPRPKMADGFTVGPWFHGKFDDNGELWWTGPHDGPPPPDPDAGVGRITEISDSKMTIEIP